MATNPSISSARRKLERLELAHLRQHCASLQEQLEHAQNEVEWARQSADFWQQHAQHLQEATEDDLAATHRCVGLSKSGELMVVQLQQ